MGEIQPGPLQGAFPHKTDPQGLTFLGSRRSGQSQADVQASLSISLSPPPPLGTLALGSQPPNVSLALMATEWAHTNRAPALLDRDDGQLMSRDLSCGRGRKRPKYNRVSCGHVLSLVRVMKDWGLGWGLGPSS